MKTRYFIFALLLWFVLCGSLFATNHYLSTSSSGSGSGLSWANKLIYTSFSFSSLGAGDIVYMDGGTDSVTYGVWSISKTVSGGIITITKGIDAGHNGKVIFERTSGGVSDSYILQLSSCSNIKLFGMIFKWSDATDNTYDTQHNPLYVVNSHDVTLDHDTVYSNGNANMVAIYTSYNISVTNCWLEVLPNSIYISDQNNIVIWGNGSPSTGGNKIIGNTLIQAGQNDQPHNECILIGASGSDYGSSGNPKPITTIANNFFYYGTTTSQGATTGIYTNQTHCNSFLVYNNIFSFASNPQIDIVEMPSNSSSYKSSLYYYNNTCINQSSTGGGLCFGYLDTLVMKNNIISVYGNSANNIRFTGGTTMASITYKDIDYNQYYRASGFYAAGISANWTTWRNYTNTSGGGVDAHSLTSAPSFLNLWGTSATDYRVTSSSGGINTGVTISTVGTDYFNTSRPQGSTYDIGAYEYVSAVTIPTVTTTTASSIDTATATSGGNVTSSGGATVTSRGVCWNTSANPTTSNSHTSDGSGIGIFTSSISGLNNNTLYHYRSYAVNSVGTAYGSDLTFTTLGVVTPPVLIAPTNGSSGQTITSILTWSPVVGATSYGYQLYYYYYSSGAWTSILLFSGSTASTSVTLSLPMNNRYYTWRVNATGTGGTSAWSSIYSFQTTPCQ